MRSKDKLEVTLREMPQFGNKKWVRVRHKQTGFAFIPSFEDLFRIIQAICECEDEKYPSPNQEGREMVRRFLWDACDEEITFEQLLLNYEIPMRES